MASKEEASDISLVLSEQAPAVSADRAGPGVPPAKAEICMEEDDKTIAFACHACGLSEQCEYRGCRPPFPGAGSVRLLEPTSYVMRDPWAAPGRGQLLLLGSDCALCGRPVCQDATCSVFFARRFCLSCARARAEEFPQQLRAKLTGS